MFCLDENMYKYCMNALDKQIAMCFLPHYKTFSHPESQQHFNGTWCWNDYTIIARLSRSTTHKTAFKMC